jgi:bidirectional [NiFe] hydrogenase diaphorase subunit
MSPEELKHISEAERDAQARVPNRINVCLASGCLSSQSQATKDALENEIAGRGWKERCQIRGVGCMGLCAQGALVSTTKGVLYQKVQPEMQPKF